MFKVIFHSMVITSLRDKISLFYALLFPIGLIIGFPCYLYFDYFIFSCEYVQMGGEFICKKAETICLVLKLCYHYTQR